MARPQWRDRLREELRKRNLPPAYAARLIEELADHVTDLEQENPNKDAQMLVEEKLGSPESLAEAAAVELAGRMFAGRHPVLTFLVAPIPATVLTLAAVLLVCLACKSVLTSLPRRCKPESADNLRVGAGPAYGIVFVQRFPAVCSDGVALSGNGPASRPACLGHHSLRPRGRIRIHVPDRRHTANRRTQPAHLVWAPQRTAPVANRTAAVRSASHFGIVGLAANGQERAR